MKEWTVEFGSKVIHVDADTAEDAINAAYLEIGVRLSTLVLKPSGTPFLVKESQQLNAGSSVKNILRFMMLEPRNQKPN
jgi:hypothetical protein